MAELGTSISKSSEAIKSGGRQTLATSASDLLLSTELNLSDGIATQRQKSKDFGIWALIRM